MYLRINLDILSRDVDYSSITNPVFQLDAAGEGELELPSAYWREEELDDTPEAGTGGRALPPSRAPQPALLSSPSTRPLRRQARRLPRRRLRRCLREGMSVSVAAPASLLTYDVAAYVI